MKREDFSALLFLDKYCKNTCLASVFAEKQVKKHGKHFADVVYGKLVKY